MIHVIYIGIGLFGLWILRSIALNQHLIAKNQVQQLKRIEELFKDKKK